MQAQLPEGVLVQKHIPLDYADIYLRSDGIIQINSSDNIAYTIKETMQVHNLVNTINEHQPKLILHVAGEYTTVDTDTRYFLASEEGLRYVTAMAFVIRSLAQRILGNFFLRFNNPPKPTKLFTSQNEAEKWLKSMLKKNVKKAL